MVEVIVNEAPWASVDLLWGALEALRDRRPEFFVLLDAGAWKVERTLEGQCNLFREDLGVRFVIAGRWRFRTYFYYLYVGDDESCIASWEVDE